MPAPQEATEPLLPSEEEDPRVRVEVEDKVPPESRGWRDEAFRLLKLALPISLSEAFSYLSRMITVAQVGRLGSVELSAMSLAQTVYNITGLSLVIGIGSGVDTFSGQAFGAMEHQLLGVILQRATLLCWLVAVGPLAAWTQADQLMRHLGQQPQLTVPASHFIHIAAVGLPVEAVRYCTSSYLSTQNVVRPLTAVSIITTAATPALNHLFIYTLGWGFTGAAVAAVSIQMSTTLLIIGVALRHNYLQPAGSKPWTGFSSEAFLNWLPYLRVALPSAAMICLDWWAWEVLTLIAGLLPDASTAVAAVGICWSLHVLIFFLVSGLGSAASIRISNELGAGKPEAVQQVLRTAVLLSASVAALLTLPMWLFPRATAGLFTQDPVVIQTVLGCMPGLLLSLMGDSVNTVLSGAVRGAGKQVLGFTVNLCSYWLLGLPLALHVGVQLGHGAPGLWWAMVGVSALQALLLSVFVARIDWEREVLRSQHLVRSQSSRPRSTDLLLPGEAAGAAAAGAAPVDDEEAVLHLGG